MGATGRFALDWLREALVASDSNTLMTCVLHALVRVWRLLCFSRLKEAATMSDIPPTARELHCSFCGAEFTTIASLRVHQIYQHKRVAGGGERPRARKRRGNGLPGSAHSGGDGDSSGQRTGDASPAPRRHHATVDNRGGAATHEPNVSESSLSRQGPTTAAERAVAVDRHLDSLLALSRMPVQPEDGGTSRCEAPAGGTPEYSYTTVVTAVRAFYESFCDKARARPLVVRRKKPKTGRFNSYRLRALQDFVLSIGGAGLSQGEQKKLFEFLNIWDRTQKGMPEDSGHFKTLKDSFATCTAFQSALHDDIDDAVLGAGWMKVKLAEGNVEYEAYFRSVMEVILGLLEDAKEVRWWSGPDGPAPPSDNRESPLDGDAFKLCELEVMRLHGEDSCVLAVHVFSDSSQLSWSGGTWWASFSGLCVSVGHEWLRFLIILSGAIANHPSRSCVSALFDCLQLTRILYPNANVCFPQPINCTQSEFGWSMSCRDPRNGSPSPTFQLYEGCRSPPPANAPESVAVGCYSGCSTWPSARPSVAATSALRCHTDDRR